jgi:hypothetical protein
LDINQIGSCVKIKNDEIDQVIRFYANLLMKTSLSKKLILDVEFIKNMTKIQKQQAFCNIEDLDSKIPREFSITIDANLSYKNTLLSLAHEMVHVKQYAKNELKEYIRNGNIVRWKTELIDQSKILYWDHPWEIEAFGREIGMYLRYVQSKKASEKESDC